jgi:hypothetical protein
MNELVVVSVHHAGREEQRLLDLAAWMGVPTRSVTIGEAPGSIERAAPPTGGKVSLAMTGSTLAAIRRSDSIERIRNFLRTVCDDTLIFGLAGSASDNDALGWLIPDGVSVRPGEGRDSSFRFPRQARAFSRQLADVTFQTASAASLPRLLLSPQRGDGAGILLQGEAPVFAHFRTAGSSLFVLADLPIPDVHERLSPDRGLEDVYERLTPPLIFLRHSFGNTEWHGAERTARVIIDDPLLRKRYGFLDVEQLTKSMNAIGYGTTLAFIPWYYRRTSARLASTFNGEHSNISVCVHGCDHTRNEFGIRDEDSLSRLARLAIQRMEAHERRTRIPFEKIMVFPQGRFSEEAVGALRASGYVAAVNSTCFPTGGEPAPTVGDCLRPAIQFRGFPVFHRHYPRRLIDYAVDLFLGKPVLIVEHHDYFRDGGHRLERLVEDLRALEPGLTWPTLTHQLTRSCFVKRRSEGEMDVQFYTRTFHLRNTSPRAMRYLLSKPEPDPSVIHQVRAEGVSVPFCVQEAGVRFQVDVDAGTTARIEIEDREHPPRPAFQGSMSYGARVGLRRILSELRDEGPARHPTPTRALMRLAGALGVRYRSGSPADGEHDDAVESR